MRVEFTGRHVDITEAIKKHTKEQLEKIEKVFDFEKAGKAHIILEVEKHRHQAEIIFRWRDQELTVQAETEDMYTAISQAADKLERQALRLKEKKTDQKRHSPSTVAVIGVPELAAEEATNTNEPRIVRSERYATKPMRAEEAMQELRISEDYFLVFRNAETDGVAVIYKRNDGNFGLIEP
ncbi:MAG: ribosome-associated translation inhibitor RaiA [Blastocatellia bacterium]|nr:ribosome-associated translation inhibitor RaiA [Blastocatellia bacterium]